MSADTCTSTARSRSVALLGLTHKESGDAIEGERLIRQSIELEPKRAEFHCNLANLLRRQQRLREAEHSYRRALALEPKHQSALFGLTMTLQGLQQLSAAEQCCRRLLHLYSEDVEGWSALGLILSSQERYADAEQAYRRALSLRPDYPVALHNLASVLCHLEQTEEALHTLTRIGGLGIKGFEVTFNRGRCLVQLYRLQEAEAAFAEAVRLQPQHLEAQVNLARLRFMRGDPEFVGELAHAVSAYPENVSLHLVYAMVLRRAAQGERAEEVLRSLLQQNEAPEVHAALAEVLHEMGRSEEAAQHAGTAAAVQPQHAGIIETYVSILLSLRRAEEALPYIERQHAREPLVQSWITYEATAARLLGRPEYHELFDYQRLVRVYDLDPPPGWSSISDLNRALLASLKARHPFKIHPLDQSLRHGSQTARNLLKDPDPIFQTTLASFAAPLADYVQHLGRDPSHPLSARNTGRAAITAAWSIQLRRDGFHVNHIHPQGWISSAYYIEVPPEVDDAQLRSGWLKFGEPRFPIAKLSAEHYVQPRAGRLVLFPSYMWHGTNPIIGSETRTTIAFDAVPVS